MARRQRDRRYAADPFWTVALTAGLLASFVIPSEKAERLPSLCPSAWLLGRRCLGCGTSRSFALISHGRLRRAWKLNPLSFATYPLTMLLVAAGWRSLLSRDGFAWPAR